MDGQFGFIFRDEPCDLVWYQLTPGLCEKDACSGLGTVRSSDWKTLVLLLLLDPLQASAQKVVERDGGEMGTSGVQCTRMNDFNTLWESECPSSERCFFRTSIRPGGAESGDFLFFLECFKPWYNRFGPVLKLPLSVLREHLDDVQEQIEPPFRGNERRARMAPVRRRLTYEGA